MKKTSFALFSLIALLGSAAPVMAEEIKDGTAKNVAVMDAYVEKFEIEQSTSEHPIEVIMRKKKAKESFKVTLSQSVVHQAFYSALLVAFSTNASVDVITDSEGFVTRLELERKKEETSKRPPAFMNF